MLKLSKHDKVDREKYHKHLGYLGYIYYDLDELISMNSVFEQRCSSLRYLLNQTARECSGGNIYIADTKGVRDFLIRHRNVPEYLLQKKDKGVMKPSIASTVLTNVKEKGYDSEFIDMWILFRSMTQKNGYIKTAMHECEECDAVTEDGRRLYKITHNFSENNTFRTYYSDYNHQQLPKECTVALKAPKGYTLVKGDFAQSDLKIAYNMLLRDPSNYDVMYNCKDSYEGFARMMEGPDFSLERFKRERDVYKQNSLAPLYGGSKSNTVEGQRVRQNVSDYLETIPSYVTFKNRLDKRLNTGLPVTVRTYFGNEILIQNFEKNKNALLNEALNAPMQGGTSEVVIHLGNAIMDRFKEKGITEENGGIYLYLNRHDELVFLVKNEYMEYSYIFQECEDVIIDDWMPLKIAFSFSDNYWIPNERIDNMFKAYYKEPEMINVPALIEKARKSKVFIPCDDTLSLVAGYCKNSTANKTVLCFLNTDSGKVTYHEVGSVDTNDIIESIIAIINSKAIDLINRNVTAAIVYTDLLYQDKIIGARMPISFKKGFDSGLFLKAMSLAESKANEVMSNVSKDVIEVSNLFSKSPSEQLRPIDRIRKGDLEFARKYVNSLLADLLK